MKAELNVAKDVAIRAGEILLEHYSRPPAVDWKGANDPVTDADRAASGFITAQLEQAFPQDGVVSEETPDNAARLGKSRVWFVDPMDGTKEYISRRPEFSVMIGLSVDGVAKVGVVYQPVTRKLYYGAPGMGAFLLANGSSVALTVSEESNPSSMTIALSRSHPSQRVERLQQLLGIERSISTGSIGLKIGLICEGLAHLYLYPGSHTFQWDTCAPEAILVEAGGRMTDLSNRPLIYNRSELRNSSGVIASSGRIHDRIAETMRLVG